MHMTNSHTSSLESGHTKIAGGFVPERMDDNTSDLAFFGFKGPSLRTFNDDTPVSPKGTVPKHVNRQSNMRKHSM